MPIETLYPKDEAEWLSWRKNDVTSTETAALFGLSPYLTPYELYFRKHDNREVEFKQNERMTWGLRLQDSIAAGIAEDQGWTIRRMTEYIRDPELRAGASFDFEYVPMDGEPSGSDKGILEVKNVDSLAFKDGWIVDGDNVEAPAHIEVQVQQQLMLSGRATAWIGALIGGNRVVLIKRIPDETVINAIKEKISAFWESVDADAPPKPNFEKDAAFISRLYSFAQPGLVLYADKSISKLASAYKQASQEASSADDKKEAIKAELLTIIGNAEKVVGDTFSISAGLIGPKLIESYERKGYRSFRINYKKEKP